MMSVRRLETHPYPVLRTKLDTRGETFQANREATLQSLEEIETLLAKARAGGGQKYVDRFAKAGKLLPRQRIERLLDKDSYFLEVGALAGNGMQGIHPGGSVIGGVGVVSGTECLIVASDSTVKGGAINEIGVLKSNRLADIAEDNHLPGISLIESAGADLPNQRKVFVPGGRNFRDITRRSAQGQPSICLVFGSSTAGGAYVPGMSDYTVMVKNQARVYLGGPPLVKMATGEESTHEQLGGAHMHSTVSGVSDYLAEDDQDAIRIGREIMAHLRWEKQGLVPERPVEEPLYDAEELCGIASSNLRHPFDVREVIARVVDGSRFSEFKPLYGDTLVCGWAHIHGYPVGILGNNGILFSEAANKGSQFIQLCNQRNIPLIFMQNITGFMVGRAYEEGGIIKNGAKLINAVSNSTVPAITLMLGASYGAGNYGMSGRAYAPRYVFSWTSHRIAVMGGKQLAGVLEIIKRDAAAKKGEEVDEDNLKLVRMMIEQQIDNESTALFATARLWDDGIIDPRDTRSVLAICLSTTQSAPCEGSARYGVFRH